MIRLSNSIYTHNEMDRILKSNRQVKYKAELLSKDNIGLCSADIIDGNINFDSECEIMRCANLTVKDNPNVDYVNARIKLYMSVKAPVGYIDYPLGVFLIASPNRISDGRRVTRELECYDFAQILKEDKFTSRYFATKGSRYVQTVIAILESSKLFSHDITASSLALPNDIEFEIGTSKLDAINTLLKSINYTPIWFDENGYSRSSVYVNPSNRVDEYAYVTAKDSITFVGIEESVDTFNVPNIIVRYTDNPEGSFLRATWRNDNPSSRLSTISRGRNIVDIESVSDIANQTTLEQYVSRLADEQSLYNQISFDTAIMPHHQYRDCLRIQNKELDIDDTYIEYAWSMNLRIGGKMNHKCRKLVSI